MGYEYKDELRELLPFYLDILAEEGLTEYRGYGFYDCPLCGSGTGWNGTPGFHVIGDEHWTCFACGAKGDIFDLVAHMERINQKWWKEKYKRTYNIMKLFLEEIKCDEMKVVKYSDNIPNKTSKKSAVSLKQYHENEDCTEYLLKCHANVHEISYLKDRGLSEATINRFKLGYDRQKNVVTIPYNLDFKGYIHRTLWNAEFKYWKHGADLFNKEALYSSDTDYVFCCEGQFDCMSFEECGFTAVGLGSVTEVNRLIAQLVKRPTRKTVIAALDNDAKGIEATRHLQEIMKCLECKYLVPGDLYGKYKDANQFLQSNREGFEKQMQHIVDIVEGRSIEE